MADAPEPRPQGWAAPGSEHDRRVKRLRVIIPLLGAALIALLVLAPLATRGDISFVLDREGTGKAEQRLAAERTEYRGVDDQGRAFSLNAERARQPTGGAPVAMEGLTARMALEDGAASVTAERGRYDVNAERVAVVGPVRVEAPGGYRMETRDVEVDLPGKRLESRGRVEGRIPLGTFEAGSLSADLGNRTVALEGRARLKITQGNAK